MRMRARAAAVILLTAVVNITAQQPKIAKLSFPGTVNGTLRDSDERMPQEVDKPSKGGPMQAFEISIKEPAHFYALLECDSCLPRLVLLDDQNRIYKRAGNGVDAPIKIDLDKGTYWLFAGSVAGRGGDYVLRVGSEELTAKLPVFVDVTMRVQEGQKAKTYSTLTVRIGQKCLTIENADGLLRTIPYPDVEALEAATTSTSNVAAGILLGPAFGQTSHQQWITVRTKDETIALEVPAKSYQLMLSELQRVTAKK